MVGVAIVSSTSWATRQRQALERFELSELRIWVVDLKGDCGKPTVAFLDPQGYYDATRLGDYVGKFDGKVTRITKDRIVIVEIRPDGDSYKEVEVAIPVPKGAPVH
jgi:Tfp pilus assembly protein PilP